MPLTVFGQISAFPERYSVPKCSLCKENLERPVFEVVLSPFNKGAYETLLDF